MCCQKKLISIFSRVQTQDFANQITKVPNRRQVSRLQWFHTNLQYFLLFCSWSFSNIWCLSFICFPQYILRKQEQVPFICSWTKVVTSLILIFRNVPKIIEALSTDGSSGQQIESSKLDPLSGGV